LAETEISLNLNLFNRKDANEFRQSGLKSAQLNPSNLNVFLGKTRIISSELNRESTDD